MLGKWLNEQQSRFHNNSVMSVSNWIATLTLMLIPVLNIILLFKWAFSNKEITQSNKVNWARATLIMILFVTAATAIVFGIYHLGLYIHNK